MGWFHSAEKTPPFFPSQTHQAVLVLLKLLLLLSVINVKTAKYMVVCCYGDL